MLLSFFFPVKTDGQPSEITKCSHKIRRARLKTASMSIVRPQLSVLADGLSSEQSVHDCSAHCDS